MKLSMCKICHKDSEKHSAKLWLLHQKRHKCAFCGKNSTEHSEELWNIHQKVIPKNGKLVTIQMGTGPRTLARIVEWNTPVVNGREDPYHVEKVPIYLRCSECNLAISDTESDLADVLSQLCLKCFCEQTEQEYSWHSKPWWEVNGGKYSGGPLVH